MPDPNEQPAFSLQDLLLIVEATYRQAEQAINTHLLFQGASPETERAWLETEFLKPSAKVNR